jgi:hypothetical protein
MSLEGIKSFNELEGENFWYETKMHPPSGEPERKNASKLFIKINEPRMIKFWGLVEHEFRPGFNIIIIAIGNIKIGKNSW